MSTVEGSEEAIEVVQPAAYNDMEQRVAFSVEEALHGRSIFTSTGVAQRDLEESLQNGCLAGARPEFRATLLRIAVSRLEQATFEPEVFMTHPRDLQIFLAQQATDNAKRLAQVLRDAGRKLTSD